MFSYFQFPIFVIAILKRLWASASVWSFATTILRMGGSVLVLPVVLKKVSSDELGIWYVFMTTAGLTSLLDMGIMVTTARAIGYAWAGAGSFQPHGVHKIFTPKQPNKTLACELISTSLRFYQLLSATVLFLFTFVGTPYIWSLCNHLESFHIIMTAWAIFSLGTALNTVGSIWPSLLSGINQVRIAQQLQFGSTLSNYIVNLTLVLLGFGLLGPVIAKFTEAILLRLIGRILFLKTAKLPQNPTPRWSSHIFQCLWPTAWRTGLVSIGTFLIMHTSTFMLASFKGLETTASYGLSVQLVNALISISGVWVGVKIPEINQLRVQSKNLQIACIFASKHRLSLLSYISGAVFIYLNGSFLLSVIGSKTSLLPSPLLGTLLIIGLLELNHAAHAVLVVTENRNPFVIPALLSGVAIVFLNAIFAPHYGLWAVILNQGLVQAAFNNWFPILLAAKSIEMRPLILIKLILTGHLTKNRNGPRKRSEFGWLG